MIWIIRKTLLLCIVASFCLPMFARAGYYETNGYAVYEGIQTIQLRPFAHEFTTGVLWYAVTARMAAPWATDLGAKYTYIATGDSQVERHFRMGYWNQASYGSPTDGIFDSVATGINMTNWQTFLLKFDLDTSNVYGWAGNLDGYDIDIFSPPLYTNNSVAALEHFYLWKGAYMNLYIDWIGLGTEPEDVVPVPEPGLFSILGMVGIVFAAKYRSYRTNKTY